MTRFGDQAPRSSGPSAPVRPWPAAEPGVRGARDGFAAAPREGWGQPPPPATQAHRSPDGDWPDPGSQPRFDARSDWEDPALDDRHDWHRPAWQALLVMIAITTVGVVIDVIRDATGGVNYAIVVGSLVAIVIVRRVSMFPVVIAPPLVYLLGSAAVLYLRSGGPHNKSVLIDIATNWLVYGFPAMAAASLVVLVVAAVRMLTKR